MSLEGWVDGQGYRIKMFLFINRCGKPATMLSYPYGDGRFGRDRAGLVRRIRGNFQESINRLRLIQSPWVQGQGKRIKIGEKMIRGHNGS